MLGVRAPLVRFLICEECHSASKDPALLHISSHICLQTAPKFTSFPWMETNRLGLHPHLEQAEVLLKGTCQPGSPCTDSLKATLKLSLEVVWFEHKLQTQLWERSGAAGSLAVHCLFLYIAVAESYLFSVYYLCFLNQGEKQPPRKFWHVLCVWQTRYK